MSSAVDAVDAASQVSNATYTSSTTADIGDTASPTPASSAVDPPHLCPVIGYCKSSIITFCKLEADMLRLSQFQVFIHQSCKSFVRCY